MVVTGFDDRVGCGYVLSTGADAAAAATGAEPVRHAGLMVMATPELAAALRDALENRPTALASWSGPEVPLALDDITLLGWMRYNVGGVLTVAGDPGPDPRAAVR
jgi:hypothetical protein